MQGVQSTSENVLLSCSHSYPGSLQSSLSSHLQHGRVYVLWAPVLAPVKDQMENGQLFRRASGSTLECNPLLSKVCISAKERDMHSLGTLAPKGLLTMMILIIGIM